MRGYQLLYLTHANLKRKLHLVASTIVGYHWSDKSKATHVYCIGQTIFPASETPEEIDNKLAALSQEVK